MANEIEHPDDSLREETGALGERVKGAAKDAAGAVLGNEQLEREGERENAEGRRRQAENDAIAGPSRSAHGGLRLVEQEPGDRVVRQPGGSREGVSGLDYASRIQVR